MSQPSRALSPLILGGIVLGALILGVVVFRPRHVPSDLPEWTPRDHDQPEGQSGQVAPPPRQKAQPQQDGAELAELAWSRNCVTCHGDRGRGDGPQGPMLRAPDLTRAEWQARVTDDEIRQTIRGGRNNMPKFDLPPAVLDGLVKRIRSYRTK